VDHDHRIESRWPERPRRLFEIMLDKGNATRVAQRLSTSRGDVDRGHTAAELRHMPGVPSVAARHVEHACTRLQSRGEANDPSLR